MKKAEIADFPKFETELLKTWEKEKTFQQSLQNREGKETFVFYDGPPFANGLPHYGHLVSSVVKDAVPRYKTMRGYHVPRRFGWDCHGLPAEMKAEQDLDLGSKAAIEEYGVEKFVKYCRTSVTEFINEWEHYINRIGRWVDFGDSYYTMDTDYMESVMWAFKKLHEAGLVAEGYKVMPYCPVCETSLSHFEARQDDSYREVTDPAVTVKFPLETGETLLAWTTTPWTLPANLAVAVNNEITYVVMEGNGERLVLSRSALERYADDLAGYKKIAQKKGKEFVGLSYEPPFEYFAGHKKAFKVLHADFVVDEDGTGIAHEAPAYGEDDQKLCEDHDIELVNPVDKQGYYTDEITDFAGIYVLEANHLVIDHLKNQGRLFKKEDYKHPYPHCWRTDNPLIYRAVSSWIINVPEFKQKLLDTNQEINWIPAAVKAGAFGKWLEGVRNWNVSRDRYWGAPIPIWKTDDGEVLVVGSVEEMKQRAVDPSLVSDLHKPAIDKVVLKTDSGKLAHRVPEVMDCWFESGAMPFAQMHYPYENKDRFNHPADFIVEYIGQVRGWFYTLHVISTALFDSPAFKNCLSHGVILGSDGRKMSKRLGNYPDLHHVFDNYGADIMRYYLLSSPVISGETINVDEKAMQDVQRNVFLRLWNVHSFMSTYAEVDGWQPPKKLAEPKSGNVLDQWLLARLNQTIKEATKQSELYQLGKAIRPLTELIDDLSNWYVRRSRRRFWKSEDDGDKQAAYGTLHYTLARISQLLAPWSPFVADRLWRDLTEGMDVPASVHLTDWPEAGKVEKAGLAVMAEARQSIQLALAGRAAEGIKVRQPLRHLIVKTTDPAKLSKLEDIIAEEVNVKKVDFKSDATLSVELDPTITPELAREGMMRDVIRQVQNARKQAGLKVDDRIELALEAEDAELQKAIEEHKEVIASETLAKKVESKTFADNKQTTKLGGVELTISLRKL